MAQARARPGPAGDRGAWRPSSASGSGLTDTIFFRPEVQTDPLGSAGPPFAVWPRSVDRKPLKAERAGARDRMGPLMAVLFNSMGGQTHTTCRLPPCAADGTPVHRGEGRRSGGQPSGGQRGAASVLRVLTTALAQRPRARERSPTRRRPRRASGIEQGTAHPKNKAGGLAAATRWPCPCPRFCGHRR